MTDTVLWALVVLSAAMQAVSLAKPKPADPPTWVSVSQFALAFPIIALYVYAGHLTGYQQLAWMPAVAFAIAIIGVIAKAAPR